MQLSTSLAGRAVALAMTVLLANPAMAQRGPAPRAAAPRAFQLRAVPSQPDGSRPSLAAAPAVLRRTLGLQAAEELRPLRTLTDDRGDAHVRYQQYFRGVKIEHGVVTAHARGGALQTISGEVYRPAATLAVQPALAQAAARKHALRAVGAQRYMWEDAREEAGLRQRTGRAGASYFPTGELVLVPDHRPGAAAAPANLVLAWKFDVYARQPISRDILYVDARTGEVVLRDAVIKHVNAPGTFATKYSGSKQGTTDAFGGGFRLRETAHGKGVVTLNCQTGTSFTDAVDFVDNDNNWTAAEYDNANQDNAAFDAHLGAAATQDYWTAQHGRDSFDDQGSILYSYVHFDVNFDNAFWDGDEMVYGDGGGLFSALTAVDVCGHEIGHAVCETTANLVYQDESGALNEGFSDIWGACVEHHYDPTKQTWLVGEDIALTRPALRSMSDPNSLGDPDTYQGDFWEFGAIDHGGVHTNSGVLNKWFYLLSQGGNGTNDNGTTYLVTGINIDKAARIAYRAEHLYMTANTDYHDAVRTTLQAAVDLYGMSSAEATAVAQAWRAVGLNDDAVPAISALAPASGPIGTLVTITGANLSTAFRVTFNGTLATAATLIAANQLQVEVPFGATTGRVIVTTADGTATSPGNFTVTGTGTAPRLLAYTPAPGAPWGATVVVTGTNLTGATSVKFNGTTAVFTVNSATQLTATVPTGATTGALRVTTPSGSATAPTPFVVLPAITTLSPTSGAVGTLVALTGTSFTNALTVKFNGTYATYTVVSATRINATVPVGATTGPVTVRTEAGTASSPVPFVVTPTIAVTDFSPPSGPPLTTIVTVYGYGFTGATVVRFNNTPATTFSVASDTEIWATVPAGATTGPIRVTSPVGTASSAAAFNVLVPGAPQILDFSPQLGPVGTTVTLTGLDFAGVSSVKFNGTPATITSSTATRLVVTVPPGATTGQISVTTPLGLGVSATSFRVVVPPANDLCAAAIPVTCGTSLTGSCLGATTTGDPTANCGVTVDGPGVFYRFVGTGQSVTVNTCSAATTYDSKLHVFRGACGSFTCVGGDDDGCGPAGGGSTVTFTSVAGTTYFFLVSGWNGLTGDFGLNVTCTGPTPTSPTIASFTPATGPVGTVVTVTGTNLGSVTALRFGTVAAIFTANGAGTQLTATVPNGAGYAPLNLVSASATTPSAASFCTTYTPAATPASRCGAGTLTLTASGAPAGGSYRWYTTATGGTPLANTTATFTTPSLSATTTYYVAAAMATACIGPRVPVVATIRAAPTVTISGATTTCAGTPVTLTASGATTYLWSTGATTASITVSTSGTYSVTGTVVGGCAAATATRTVTVAPLPATPTAAPAARCGAGTLTLTASGAPAGGSYRWYTTATGGTALATTTATLTTPSLSTTTTYYVAARSGGGCEGARRAVTATINAAPAASLAAGGPTTFCAGGSVTLTATAVAGGTYQFARNGTVIAGATSATFSATQAGAYTVTVTRTGCAATSAPLTVTVSAPPAQPTIVAAPQPAGTVLLTSSAPTGNQWYRNGALIVGATAQTYLVTAAAQNGAYTVRVTSAANCPSAPSAAVTTTVTGTAAALAAAAGLLLYPNPTADGRVTLELTAFPAPQPLTVFDAAGRAVLRADLPAGTTRYELDAHRLSAGVYAVRVGSAVRRLVRE